MFFEYRGESRSVRATSASANVALMLGEDCEPDQDKVLISISYPLSCKVCSRVAITVSFLNW